MLALAQRFVSAGRTGRARRAERAVATIAVAAALRLRGQCVARRAAARRRGQPGDGRRAADAGPDGVTADLVGTIMQHVYETLYTFDAKWNVVPMLAEACRRCRPTARTTASPCARA